MPSCTLYFIITHVLQYFVLTHVNTLTCEKKHDHQRVDDGEPMDLFVGCIKINIPTARPLDVRVLELDVVREDHLRGFRG